MEDSSLSELVSKPARDGVPLDLLFTEKGWWEMLWLEAIWGTVTMK